MLLIRRLQQFADRQFDKANGQTDVGYDPTIILITPHGTPIALLIDADSDTTVLSSYQVIGQHSPTCGGYVTRCTSAKRADQVACESLIQDLVAVGYRPYIARTHAMKTIGCLNANIGEYKQYIGSETIPK